MEERGQNRVGVVWANLVLGIVAVGLLFGCVSQETIKKRVKEAEGHYQQGLSIIEGDQQRAFVAFQKAVQLNPGYYDAHYALGTIYYQRQVFAEAEREFRTCLDLDPNSGDALNFLGRTLIELARYPEAIEFLKKASTMLLYATPDIAFVNLGDALYLQGDLPGAVRAYQSALKIEPPNVPRALVYFKLGDIYMKQGEDAKARDAFAQVKALDPQGKAGAEASKLLERLR